MTDQPTHPAIALPTEAERLAYQTIYPLAYWTAELPAIDRLIELGIDDRIELGTTRDKRDALIAATAHGIIRPTQIVSVWLANLDDEGGG